MRNAALLATTFLTAAIAVSTAATAQETRPVVAADAGDDSGKIADIVVTAERRSESVQRSSLAIQVLSGDALRNAGVSQARDLTRITPGVQIGQGGPATQIYIRGVGDFTSTPITNPAVAVNVDGVYVARAQSIEGNFFDVERIEVLKGPQGTLYGRNASAGAINIITNKPKLGIVSADISLEVGNYDLVKAEAALNLPLGDKVAVRGAFQIVHRSGYSGQGLDDDKHESARLQMLFEPSDRFSLRLSGDYAHVGGNGAAYVFKAVDPTVAAGLAALGVAMPGARATGSDLEQLYYGIGRYLNRCIPNGALAAAATSAGGAPITGAAQGLCPTGQSSLISAPGNSIFGDVAYVNNRFYNLSAEANYDLDFATLTVLGGYRNVKDRYIAYPLVTYNDSFERPETSRSYSLEARLGQSSGALKWVIGGFYFDERQKAATSSNGGLIIGRSINRYELGTKSYAAFGQLTYSVSDPLRVIAGIRYSRDDKTIDGQNLSGYPGLPFIPGQPCFGRDPKCLRDTFVGKERFTNTAWKLGVEYDLGPQNMLFATATTGYKSGGFNPVSQAGTVNVASSYGPEKLTAFELGSRNRFLDSALQINVEGFYWKYKDSQQFYSTTNAAGNAVNALANAGSATIYGLDLDMIAKPTPADTITLGVEYLQSKFDSFVYQAAGPIQGVTTGCAVTAGAPFSTIDCSGKPLSRAPKLSGTASITHSFELANDKSIDVTISGQYMASRYLTLDFTDAVKAKRVASGDASITYRMQNGVSLTGFVRNFTDEKIYTGAYTLPALFRSLTLANIGAPRTYGVRLAAHF